MTQRVVEAVRGTLFRELLEMLREELDPETGAQVEAKLHRQGHLDDAGERHYDHLELLEIVEIVSAETNLGRSTLLRLFGRFLFRRFQRIAPDAIRSADSVYTLMPLLDGLVDRLMLQQQIETDFPQLKCVQQSGGMEITHRSSQPLGDLAEGFIRAAINHYASPVRLDRNDFRTPHGFEARFFLAGTDDAR